MYISDKDRSVDDNCKNSKQQPSRDKCYHEGESYNAE